MIPPIPRGLHPITVFQARYGGTYEPGAWVATGGHMELPIAAFGDDVTCANYWAEEEDNPFVAGGDTPNQAVAHLVTKWEASQ